MSEPVVKFGLFFLNPLSKLEFILKISTLYCASTAIAVFIATLSAPDHQLPLFVFFAVTFVVAAPLLILAMASIRRLMQLQDDLIQMTTTDVATGLANRAFFLREAEANSSGQIVVLEIDEFAHLVAQFGDDFTDDLLLAVADHVRKNLRGSDVVSKLSRASYAIYLKDSSSEKAEHIAKRMTDGVLLKLRTGEEISITLSAGLVANAPGFTMEDLLRFASLALGRAKSAGHASFRSWDIENKRPISVGMTETVLPEPQ
ncbi:MAG: diguanylate cyclase [Boseongicola sp.]|nr:diguanylate cyclase [Boseongicola sp.]